MATKFDMKVTGLDRFMSTFRRLASVTPEELGLAREMTIQAERIMGESKRLVPVVSGALRASGLVQPPVTSRTKVEVVMGYGGAARRYAWKVHENPRAGQTGGLAPVASFNNPFASSIRQRRYKRFSQVGQWKYLETPFVAAKNRTIDAIAAAVGKNLVK
jgi:hypothetical protein